MSDGLPRAAQFSQTEPIANLAGDVTGDNTAAVVAKLKSYAIGAGAPTVDGDVLQWNVGASEFQFGQLSPAVGGDLSGSVGAATVVAIRGAAVSAAAKSDGQLMEWNDTGSQWDYASLGGDLGGKPSAAVVERLQGRAVQDHAPLDGEVLTWVTANARWEPVSVSGGGATWASLYSAGKYLDIDGAVLQWEQTVDTGSGFRVYRDLDSTKSNAPIMVVENVNAGDDQAALSVIAAAGSPALRVARGVAAGEFVDIAYSGILGSRMTSDAAPSDFTIRGQGAWATAVSNVQGGDLILEGGPDATGEGAGRGGIVRVGSSFATTHGLQDLDDFGVEGNFELHGVGYFNEYVTMVDSHAATPVLSITQQDAGGVVLNLAGTPGDRFTVYGSGITDLVASSAAYALKVKQESTGSIVSFQDSSAERWKVLATGLAIQAPADNTQALDINCALTNVAGDFAGVTVDVARSVDVTEDDRDVYNIKSTVVGRAGDTSTTTVHHAAFRADFSGTLPTDYDVRMEGVSIGAGFLAGVYSESTGIFEVDTANSLYPAALAVFNTAASGTNASLFVGDGTVLSNTGRFSVDRGGRTSVSASVSTNYAVDIQNDTSGGGLLRLVDDLDSKNRVTIDLDGKTYFNAAHDADYGAAFEVYNEWSTYGATGMVFQAVSYDGSTSRATIRSYNNGQTQFQTHSTASAVPVLNLIQTDVDEAFISFGGDEQADQSASISTQLGDGSNVVGPLDKTTTWGWQFGKMIKVQVSGGDTYYICAYQPAP